MVRFVVRICDLYSFINSFVVFLIQFVRNVSSFQCISLYILRTMIFSSFVYPTVSLTISCLFLLQSLYHCPSGDYDGMVSYCYWYRIQNDEFWYALSFYLYFVQRYFLHLFVVLILRIEFAIGLYSFLEFLVVWFWLGFWLKYTVFWYVLKWFFKWL